MTGSGLAPTHLSCAACSNSVVIRYHGWDDTGCHNAAAVFFCDHRDHATADSAPDTFAGAGSYAYHCQIHPSMTGTITVTG